MRKLVFFAFFFALTFSHFVEAQLEFKPTTTLATETGNNTSAPNSINSHTNGHAPVGNVSKVPTQALLYSGSTTKVYAALMGWFGKSNHISVGYASDDPAQVKRQVADMVSRGMHGAILAWYGQSATAQDNTGKLLMKEAELYPDFKFSIMIDHGALRWYSNGLPATDAMIMHLNYVADTFYGSPAYLRINGRPVVIEFALEKHPIDWAVVRSSVRGNPMIIFRNPNGWTRPFSDGAYAWGPADTTAYLDYFYQKSEGYPLLQTLGGTSPSFDDSLASWSEQRYVSPRCGQTWLDTFAVQNKWFSAAKPLKFLQIATWNDYEEGSTIESGIDNCIDVSAEAAGTVVRWSLSGGGQENTIHHYSAFLSKDGQNLMPLVDLPRGAREFDLAPYKFAAGTYQIYVKAVGMPSILNRMSSAVTVTVPGAAAGPAAGFTVTAASQDVTVQRGASAQVQITAAPQNGFSGSVSFACSGLPKGAACSFSSTTVNVASSAAAVTVTLSTTGAHSAALTGTAQVIYAGMLLPLVFASPRLVRSNRRRVVLLTASALMMLCAAGCGAGATVEGQSSTDSTKTSASMTPPGTYTVVVTATSGSIQQTVPIKLIVR